MFQNWISFRIQTVQLATLQWSDSFVHAPSHNFSSRRAVSTGKQFIFIFLFLFVFQFFSPLSENKGLGHISYI